jgi:hypothetical protein
MRRGAVPEINMHFVTAVEYLSGYRLRVGFEDGCVKIVDLETHLDGEVFEPLNGRETKRVQEEVIAW